MPKAKASVSKASKGQPDKQASAARAPPPSWPQFKPPLPVTDLALEPLEQCPEKVVLVHHFWPKSLCQSYVSFLRGLSLATTPGRPKRGEAVRVNDRFQVEDAVFARRLWLDTGLQDALQHDDEKRGLW